MKLYLVRHGKACARDVDPERPLTHQGREDIRRLAAFLERAGIRVERVIHGGKLRAVRTAARLAEAMVEYAVLSIEQRKTALAPRNSAMPQVPISVSDFMGPRPVPLRSSSCAETDEF